MIAPPAAITTRSASERLMWLTILLLITIVVAQVAQSYLGDGREWWRVLLHDLLQFFNTTIAAFLLANVFFEFYVKSTIDEQNEKAIATALTDDPKSYLAAIVQQAIATSLNDRADDYLAAIARRDDADKQKFMQKAVSIVCGSLLGRKDADLLWTDLLSRYVEKRGGFRRKFSYRIELCEMTAGSQFVREALDRKLIDDGDRFCRDYLICRQSIEYAKDDGVTNAQGLVEAVFALDALTLHTYMARGDVYFRDTLIFGDDLSRRLQALSRQDMQDWFSKGMCLQATNTHTRARLAYTVGFVEGSDKRAISIAITPDEPPGPDQLITLSFTIPHHRADPHYLVRFPEPIESPHISFAVDLPRLCVEEFVFFGSRKPPRIVSAPTRIDVHGEGWAFPTSGVLFVWRPE